MYCTLASAKHSFASICDVTCFSPMENQLAERDGENMSMQCASEC